MPYYCTVPRCTSMAGKAKNVSFHQFPRDEELAKLWNNILKRGKPYTKYSKVCSLHFKPEDYTITSAGKNKGQWRTLRKDAIPSQNLPSDSPAPYQRKQPEPWVDTVQSNSSAIHTQLHQQLAQAIYMQTMLAMQAAGVPEVVNPFCNGMLPPRKEHPESPSAHSSKALENETSDQLIDDNNESDGKNDASDEKIGESDEKINESDRKRYEGDEKTNESDGKNVDQITKSSYKCDDCSKCFKDPDVFILHKRVHRNVQNGKENFDLNSLKPEMLKSNPILANLLKNTVDSNIFNTNLLNKELLLSISSVNNYLSGVNNNSDCDNYSDNSMSDNLDDNLSIDESVAEL